ncbi:hypothetical protein FP798_16890, partial [Salmonella enterica]|nr:hypothetical protein [Salmonella enterica]
ILTEYAFPGTLNKLVRFGVSSKLAHVVLPIGTLLTRPVRWSTMRHCLSGKMMFCAKNNTV